MRFFRILFLSCLLFSAFCLCNAQNSKSDCQSNTLKFPCPKGIEVKSNQNLNGIFLAQHPKNAYAVFVYSSENSIDDSKQFKEVLEKVIQSYYSTKFEDYIWKDSYDFGKNNLWSEYEIKKYSEQGFNKSYQHAIGVKATLLNYKQKNIFVGYLYESIKGNAAESIFNNSSGGSSFTASESLLEVISNITGERKKDVNSSPTVLPPMASPKKRN